MADKKTKTITAVGFEKVLKHMDKEEIIKRLISGDSTKSIELWLKKKHPKVARLQISSVTLQKFRKENLNIEGDVLDSIKQARLEADISAKEAEVKSIITSSNAYQEKLNEIVTSELDVTRKLLEMDKIMSNRIETYFNAINSNEKVNDRQDKMFLDYLKEYRGIMQDWKKYVEGVADQKIEHNVNVNIVNDQVTILKNIVFEVLQELDPSMIPIFVEKINVKLGRIDYDTKEYRAYQIGMVNE